MAQHLTNTDYEIMTPDGWKSFDGIRKVQKQEYVCVTTDDSSLTCSNEHLINTKSGWKSAHDISTDDVLLGTNNSTVKSVEYVHEEIELYDILEVEGHSYLTNNIVSHNCDFIGSSNTLISSHKLHSLSWVKPQIQTPEGLSIYEKAKPNRIYVCCVDTSRGIGKDYSAFTIVDITTTPYKVVAKYRNNTIPPMVYPTVVKRLCEEYNMAFCLVEINDIGGQVADILYDDLEYENVLFTSNRGRKGQTISGGFGSGSETYYGVRTTQPVKRTGCSVLKSLIEEDKLIVEDINIVQELITFVGKQNTWQADDGHTDDLVMCLVLFAWLTRQEYFKNLTDIDVRTDIYQGEITKLETDTMPFGFISDGIEFEEDSVDGAWDGQDRWYSDGRGIDNNWSI